MANKSGVICAKFPDELLALAEDRALAEGITISELLRAVMTQFLLGNVPAVTEGYQQAKSTALFLAHTMLQQALAMLPETVEEAFENARAMGRRHG